MKGKFLQPVVFNAVTIVAMLLSLIQVVAVARGTMTFEVIAFFDDLIEEGEIEDETLPVRLAAEQDERIRYSIYVLTTVLVAILANVAANYIGRGRHFENTARIRELEAELRGLRNEHGEEGE